MSEKEEIRAEVHRSVLCVAIGKLTIQISFGWGNAYDRLKDRVPPGLHPIVDDVLIHGHVSSLDMLRAFRIGALRSVDGMILHKGNVLDQTIAWVFISICVLMSVLIGEQSFGAKDASQAYQGLAVILALGLTALFLGAKVIYPHWVAGRVARFLERRYP